MPRERASGERRGEIEGGSSASLGPVQRHVQCVLSPAIPYLALAELAPLAAAEAAAAFLGRM